MHPNKHDTMTKKSLSWRAKRALFHLAVRTSNALFGKEIVHRSALAGKLNRLWRHLTEYCSPLRRRQAAFERAHPDAPWFVPAAITAIDGQLQADHVGLEWGCGRSTLWLAKRVRHVTSVEGRRAWFDEVSGALARDGLGDKVELCLAEVTSEHDFDAAEIERYAAVADRFADGSLDFIVVDGHFRHACLARVGHKLRSGGLLIVDNSEVVTPAVLEAFAASHRQSWNNGIWETTVINVA